MGTAHEELTLLHWECNMAGENIPRSYKKYIMDKNTSVIIFLAFKLLILSPFLNIFMPIHTIVFLNPWVLHVLNFEPGSYSEAKAGLELTIWLRVTWDFNSLSPWSIWSMAALWSHYKNVLTFTWLLKIFYGQCVMLIQNLSWKILKHSLIQPKISFASHVAIDLRCLPTQVFSRISLWKCVFFRISCFCFIAIVKILV